MTPNYQTSDFDFELPTELIAQTPLEDRVAARMMVLNRTNGEIRHATVRDLPMFLAPGDLMVLNDTRVIPARIYGYKEASGGSVELLMLEETGPHEWEALCGSSRRPRVGTRIILANGRITATVTKLANAGKIGLSIASEVPVMDILEVEGVPPLPPYIKRKGAQFENTKEHDREFYQTVYARVPGAVAAPTAGLHFTESLLEALTGRGIHHVNVTLHVGIGTFKPVSAELVADHIMEQERYTIPSSTAEAITCTRRRGGRILAVGSTVVRTLETVADEDGYVTAGSGRTRIFIHPPYRIRAVNMMLTNFHLPRSTLLMMVSAMAGIEFVKRAYHEAIREGYRFYSYGDCMLIL